MLAKKSSSGATPQLLSLVHRVLLEDETVEQQTVPASQVYSSFQDAYDEDVRIKLEARTAILAVPMLDAEAVAQLLGGTAHVNRREAARRGAAAYSYLGDSDDAAIAETICRDLPLDGSARLVPRAAPHGHAVR